MATTTTNLGLALPADSDYVKDGAAQIRLTSNQLEARAGNQWPLLVNTGTGSVTWTASQASSTAGITFPTGRFTVAPNVFITHLGGLTSANITPIITARTSTALSVQLISSTALTSSASFMYLAIQHTATTANG